MGLFACMRLGYGFPMKAFFAALLCPLFAHAGSTTFADLEKVLADPDRKIESLETLLAQPEFGNGFLAGYTLMFASRSRQEASAVNPRAIVYGEDAQLVLSFTCAPGNCLSDNSPHEPGKDLQGAPFAELIHWIPEKREFEFREITFPAGARAQLSEANPMKCMGCHMGPDLRPNWESYGQWPGAYGGDADHLAGDLVEGEDRQKLQEFLSTAHTRPRYRHLLNLVEGYESNGARDRQEHNTDLTRRLFALNLQKISDRLRQMPDYEQLKYPIAYATGFAGKLSTQVQDAGFPDLARQLDRCLSPRYEMGKQPQFTSVVSQLIRLAFAFGTKEALKWHMSAGPTLRSEANDADNTDKSFIAILRKDDPTIDISWMELREKVRQSWQTLALRQGLSAGITACVRQLGPPYWD